MEKFLKIYIWQAISILLSFASLFIVTPYLTSKPSIFGIYTIITSLILFLSYADLGFISAGTKYASEYVAQKNLFKEIKILGFVGFIFLIFVLIYAVVVFYLAYNPSLVLKGLNEENAIVASRLLTVLAISSPIYIGQRLLQIIFSVRLEDYRYQRIIIISNIVKIISVLYFFRSGRYDIVGYFAFSQICGLLAILFGIFLAKQKYSYDFKLLVRSFRFNADIYKTTNKLAFSSLFLTVCWIAYYDLPPFIISKLLGTYPVAMYAIGLTLIGLFRALFGIIFSPFNTKFNYFVGLKDLDGLKDFWFKVISFSIPITVFPVLVLAITAKSFIFSWVGSGYLGAVTIAQFLVLSYLWSFISYPAGMLIIALENVKSIIVTSAILPIVYWFGVWLSYSYWGINSFALFKLVAFSLAAVVYTIVLLKMFKLNIRKFLMEIIIPAVLPIALLIIVLFLVRDYLPSSKSKINLMIYGVVMSSTCGFALLVYYYSSKIFRLIMNEFFLRMKTKYLKTSNTQML